MATQTGQIRARAALARDEEYSYDGLHRLIQENRGRRDPTDPTATGWSYGDNSRKWGLDMLGNWSTFLTDLDGSGTFVQSESQNRTHNSANEILTVKYVGVTGNKTQTHDDAGNWVMQTLANGNEKHFIYDAWNRLVEVAQGPNGSVDTLTRYTYYGLHQRATSRADADMTSSDADERVHYYYDASWRCSSAGSMTTMTARPMASAGGGSYRSPVTPSVPTRTSTTSGARITSTSCARTSATPTPMANATTSGISRRATVNTV